MRNDISRYFSKYYNYDRNKEKYDTNKKKKMVKIEKKLKQLKQVKC